MYDAAPSGYTPPMARFSYLDLYSSPWDIFHLASVAEECGYHRIWVGEHHGTRQVARPLMTVALMAGMTERIRVGSGGVCMAFSPALTVAEEATLLEDLFPGRVDVGMARGMPLRGPLQDAMPAEPDVRTAMAQVADWVRHGLPTTSEDVRMSPPETPPSLWLLSGSPDSAEFAARHGLGHCLSVHGPGPEAVARLVRTYREQADPERGTTATMLVGNVHCAGSREEAVRATRNVGRRRPDGSRGEDNLILGTPPEVADQIRGFLDRYDVDEFLLNLLPRERGDAERMLRELAEELDLGSPS